MEISRDSEFVAIKNLNKLCRICLQETNMMTDISEIDRKTNLSFAEMIRNCTNKEVKEDGLLPQLICHICKEELIHAMNFQLKYNNSYKFFIEYLLNVNAEKIVDDQLLIINITEHENNGVAAFGEDCEKAYQNEEIFNCEMCTQSFSSEVERRNHQSVCKHYIRKMVICSRNNVAVPVQNHRVRLLKHSVRFNCKVCGKIFSTNYNLKRHSNIHTKVKPYACKMCNARFGRHETLEEHHSLHTDLRCGSCGQDFKTGVECNEHMFRDKCTNRYQRMLSCNICSKTYTLRKSLRIHKLLHTDNCIICPQCGKLYANEEKLKVHVSIVHQKGTNKSKDFLCHICGIKYSSKIILQQHVLSHQGFGKKFNCDICKKKFTQAHSLKTHYTIHTGEKPFICHFCSKSFNKLTNLNRHLQTYNNGWHSKKVFICNICNEKFQSEVSLNKHTKTHHD